MQNYGYAKNVESMRSGSFLKRKGLTQCTAIFVIRNSTVRKADSKEPNAEGIQEIDHGDKFTRCESLLLG